jgi:enoyl-CoA hydratase
MAAARAQRQRGQVQEQPVDGSDGGHEVDPGGMTDREITAQVVGSAGVVRLDRPRALNALTTAMRAEIATAFADWARNPQVYAAAIVSNSDRAFCAGGDVREMVAWGRERPDDARRSLAAEYALNWQLDCFAKPTVSLIDGMVMGSGVGISLYGTHRVAGERYRFAMPETQIGLFPDDGVSWAFARMPANVGMYLALTGREIGRADAFRLGLVTHCVSAASFKDIVAALSAADPVDPLLDDRHHHPGPGEIEAMEPAIARCFGKDSVEAIVAALETERGTHEAWAQGVLADLNRASPTSLKITHRHVRAARSMDLSATLQQDFRLASRCMQGHDFYEGVRASLIDRDQSPRWQPGRLEDVSEAVVDAYFASLGADGLQLASRSEMQAVRA